jgi:hypothetical protein
MFGFVNAVPQIHSWHHGALDHTANDKDGYMYLISVGKNDSQIFNSTINHLCIGLRYEFSTYLANIIKSQSVFVKPNVRFEVRTATVQSELLAQLSTGDIQQHDNMTWSKHGLSFVATSCSVVLLMISNVDGYDGNDLAIDDIELRVWSMVYSDFCSPS